MTEPIRKPSPPNPVPEEDLSQYENFSPAIAENGRIRQIPPEQLPENAFAWMDAPSTRREVVEDLVQIRQAEKAEKLAHQHQEVPVERAPSAQPQPLPAPSMQEVAPTVAGPEPLPQALPSVDSTPTVQTNPAPSVRPDLPSLPVLSPAEKTTRLGRTRRRKKKGKTGRKPLPQQTPTSANTVSSVTQVPPQTPQPPAQQPLHPKRRRLGWIVGVLLLAVFITVGGGVPVENIPLLRNLAYAMGFSKTDTQRMSFLRALLTWTDQSLGLKGHLAAWPQSTAGQGQTNFQRQTEGEGVDGASGLYAQMARAGGQTRLIDMQALNTLQRKQGRALDGISGTVLPEPGREDAALAAVLRDDQVTARTEANQDKGEVFFGSDNSAVNRHFQDGFDSSKMLTKIKNPYITDGKPIDWTQRTAWQLMQSGGGLLGANKELQYGAAAWQIPPSEIGETKSHRDLYHAWITSRMSKYTTNIWLKKTLVGSAFLDAEIPTTASTGLQVGGVRIDSDALAEDQEAWKKYQEFEENCLQEMTQGGGKNVNEAIDGFNSLFSTWTGSTAEKNFGFPTSCEQMLENTETKRNNFVNNLNKLKTHCDNANAGYTKLENSCAMQYFKGQCSTAYQPKFTQQWQDVETFCNKDKPDCSGKQDEELTACENEFKEWEEENNKWFNETDGLAIHTEENLLKDVGGATKFFPQVVREQTVDAQGNVTAWEGTENVENTVRAGLGQNSANFGNAK